MVTWDNIVSYGLFSEIKFTLCKLKCMEYTLQARLHNKQLDFHMVLMKCILLVFTLALTFYPYCVCWLSFKFRVALSIERTQAFPELIIKI